MGVVVGDFDRLCTIDHEWTDVSGIIFNRENNGIHHAHYHKDDQGDCDDGGEDSMLGDEFSIFLLNDLCDFFHGVILLFHSSDLLCFVCVYTIPCNWEKCVFLS